MLRAPSPPHFIINGGFLLDSNTLFYRPHLRRPRLLLLNLRPLLVIYCTTFFLQDSTTPPCRPKVFICILDLYSKLNFHQIHASNQLLSPILSFPSLQVLRPEIFLSSILITFFQQVSYIFISSISTKTSKKYNSMNPLLVLDNFSTEKFSKNSS